MWMTSCTGSVRGGFRGIWKKSVSWVEKKRVTFASSQWSCGGCHTCCGGRWKSQHRKIVPLSLCRKTFKLKDNKKFPTWTKKSSSVFRVSGFLCSMYICYENSMYVSHIHVWLCYIKCDNLGCLPGFNPRSSHTKDFKNGTWYHLA